MDLAILGLDFSPADLYYISAIRCIEKLGMDILVTISFAQFHKEVKIQEFVAENHSIRVPLTTFL